MPSFSVSRRNFLRAAGFGSAAALAGRTALPALAQSPTSDPDAELISYNQKFNNPPLLGRVDSAAWIALFKDPHPQPENSSNRVGRLEWGDVIPVYESVRTVIYDSRTPHNDVWYRTDGGWVHSAYVIPCHEVFNEPEAEVPPLHGFWAEITVPHARQFLLPSLDFYHWDGYAHRCFWQQVYKVAERAVDERGLVWYRVLDDREERRNAWILARNLRRIHAEEFAAISPKVKDKRVEINLKDQFITCFEGDRIVLQTRIASGTTLLGDDGKLRDFSTPIGDYQVQRKRPARRMQGGGIIEAKYDVPAVPWVTYFTDTGAAVHGAYWRNNYGYPKSHGCINLPPDAAKWIYRWTQPYVTDLDNLRWTAKGEEATKIVIK